MGAPSRATASVGPGLIPQIFCDLDGVLCDFDRGVVEVCGRPPRELTPPAMWGRLGRVRKGGGFYASLEWTREGRELWEFLEPYGPLILTGLPRGNWAAPQKRLWCWKELGLEAERVITCWSREKHLYCQTPGSILIDDRIDLAAAWHSRGGNFVHHTGSARDSIARVASILALSCGSSSSVDVPPSDT